MWMPHFVVKQSSCLPVNLSSKGKRKTMKVAKSKELAQVHRTLKTVAGPWWSLVQPPTRSRTATTTRSCHMQLCSATSWTPPSMEMCPPLGATHSPAAPPSVGSPSCSTWTSHTTTSDRCPLPQHLQPPHRLWFSFEQLDKATTTSPFTLSGLNKATCGGHLWI